METLSSRQVEYSIGDIIEWLLPLNKPAISTIINIFLSNMINRTNNNNDEKPIKNNDNNNK